MLKINAFSRDCMVLEAEKNKRLSVTPFGASSTTLSTVSSYADYLALLTPAGMFMYQKTGNKKFRYFIEVNMAIPSYLLNFVVTSNMTVTLKRSSGVEAPMDVIDSLYFFTTGTIEVIRNATNTQVNVNVTEPWGVIVELEFELDSIWGGPVISPTLYEGYSVVQSYSEDSNRVLRVSSFPTGTTFLQTPSYIVNSSQSETTYNIKTTSACKAWVLSEADGFPAINAILNPSTLNGDIKIGTYFEANFLSPGSLIFYCSKFTVMHDSTITRVSDTSSVTLSGAGKFKVNFTPNTATEDVRLRALSTLADHVTGAISFDGVARSPVTIIQPSPVMSLESFDEGTLPVRSVSVEIGGATEFSAFKVQDAVSIYLPKASVGTSINGGVVTSAEYAALLSKVDTITTSVGGITTKPTATKTGTSIDVAYPLASLATTTEGGLITNAQYASITSTLASDVGTVDIQVTGTVATPTVTKLGKIATIKLPLASGSGTGGGLITSAEYQAIWNTIGSPSATPLWASGVSYTLGNKVYFRGLTWECVISHASSNFDLELENWNAVNSLVVVLPISTPVSLWDVVYLTGGSASRAVASSQATSAEPPAMIVAKSATNLAVAFGSCVIGRSGLVAGDTHYLSQSVAGSTTTVKPIIGIVNPIFKVIDINTIVLTSTTAWEE